MSKFNNFIKPIIIVVATLILLALIYVVVERKKDVSEFLDFQAKCRDLGGEVVFTLPDYTCYENQIIINGNYIKR